MGYFEFIYWIMWNHNELLPIDKFYIAHCPVYNHDNYNSDYSYLKNTHFEMNLFKCSRYGKLKKKKVIRSTSSARTLTCTT